MPDRSPTAPDAVGTRLDDLMATDVVSVMDSLKIPVLSLRTRLCLRTSDPSGTSAR